MSEAEYDHEGAGVAMRQSHHGVVEQKEKIVGEPQQNAGQCVGHSQIDEQNVVDGRVLAGDAETADHTHNKDVQGQTGHLEVDYATLKNV